MNNNEPSIFDMKYWKENFNNVLDFSQIEAVELIIIEKNIKNLFLL